MRVKKVAKYVLVFLRKIILTHGPLTGFPGPPGVGRGMVRGGRGPWTMLENHWDNYTLPEGRHHCLSFLSFVPWDLVKYSLSQLLKCVY